MIFQTDFSKLFNSEMLSKTGTMNTWKIACPGTVLPTKPFSQRQ